MRKLIALSCLGALTLAALALPVHAEGEMSGFHKDLVGNMSFTARQLLSLAEATPANMFSWRPTKDVRTVSEVYMHIVGTNMLFPMALGAAPPEGLEIPKTPGESFGLMKEWEETVTTKEAVIAKLKESFEYAAKAFPQIQDLDTEVGLFGPPQTKRAFLLIIQGHAHEHLGQSIAYARSMGVVPPWSQQQSSGDDG